MAPAACRLPPAAGDGTKGLATTPLELATPLLAAVVHDLGHTGHNNAFHVATSSELALLYSDASVRGGYVAVTWRVHGHVTCPPPDSRLTAM